MKKIVLSLAMLLAIISLASCSLTPQTTIEFSSLPETVYEAREYTEEEVKALLENVSVKVTGAPTDFKLTNPVLTVVGFDQTTLKTPGSYTLVVLYGSASVVFNYTVVAKVEPQKVSTAKALQDALDKGGIIELTGDIENHTAPFVVSKSVAIYGNNYTISVTKGAERGFNVNNVSNIHVQFYNLNIVSPGERGITVGSTTDVELTINDCNITAGNYAVNLASKNNGTVITINRSHLVAYGALNLWSNSATINVNDSVLEGINKSTSANPETFATIKLNGGAWDVNNIGLKAGDTGQKNTLNIKNTTIKATIVDAGIQYVLMVVDSCAGNNISFENCTVECREGLLYGEDQYDPASNIFTIDGVRQ